MTYEVLYTLGPTDPPEEAVFRPVSRPTLRKLVAGWEAAPAEGPYEYREALAMNTVVAKDALRLADRGYRLRMAVVAGEPHFGVDWYFEVRAGR